MDPWICTELDLVSWCSQSTYCVKSPHTSVKLLRDTTHIAL